MYGRVRRSTEEGSKKGIEEEIMTRGSEGNAGEESEKEKKREKIRETVQWTRTQGEEGYILGDRDTGILDHKQHPSTARYRV